MNNTKKKLKNVISDNEQERNLKRLIKKLEMRSRRSKQSTNI